MSVFNSNQEVFDRVKNHLLFQKRRALIKDGKSELTVCAYRADNGDRCAAGCLIPKFNYNPDFEGIPFQDLPKDLHQFLFSNKVDLVLINELQTLHDMRDVSSWPEELEIVRQRWNLE